MDFCCGTPPINPLPLLWLEICQNMSTLAWRFGPGLWWYVHVQPCSYGDHKPPYCALLFYRWPRRRPWGRGWCTCCCVWNKLPEVKLLSMGWFPYACKQTDRLWISSWDAYWREVWQIHVIQLTAVMWAMNIFHTWGMHGTPSEAVDSIMHANRVTYTSIFNCHHKFILIQKQTWFQHCVKRCQHAACHHLQPLYFTLLFSNL